MILTFYQECNFTDILYEDKRFVEWFKYALKPFNTKMAPTENDKRIVAQNFLFPNELWYIISSFLSDLENLAACNKYISALCSKVAKSRILTHFSFTELDATKSAQIQGFVGFLKVYRLPSSAIVPCIIVKLNGTIKAHVLFGSAGYFVELERQLQQRDKGMRKLIFAIISDHMIETGIEPSSWYRGVLLKRCGVFAFELTNELIDMKRIEVRWRGIFNGRPKLFGIPFIVYVPRVVDRKYVHEAVFKRVCPYLRHSASKAKPPYELTAYNFNASGMANAIAFPPDYMVLDSQMHAMGEKLCIVLDFGTEVHEWIKVEMFGEKFDHEQAKEEFKPSRSAKLVSQLVERDCGLKMI